MRNSSGPHLRTQQFKQSVLLLSITVLYPLFAACPTLSHHQFKRTPTVKLGNNQRPTAANQATLATRRRFLHMFARAYFPGRTGQLMIVPRQGHFITRADLNVAFMHGSPWPYDVSIPLFFVGPAVKIGVYSMPAAQQDIAPTLAAALGTRMPPTTIGRVLPILRTRFAQPRAVFLLVLDGMRRDYFDRYADSMPTLSRLRRRSAWFTHAQVNLLPTNTAVGHSTIATGTDPRVHGITGISVYDIIRVRRHEHRR